MYKVTEAPKQNGLDIGVGRQVTWTRQAFFVNELRKIGRGFVKLGLLGLQTTL
jgi:hypothetical protein